jgi:hypothetical protein
VAENGMNQVSQYRQQVTALEHAIRQLPQLQEELHHHFAHGIYGREMRVPAGTVLVGKIHRYSCINVILQGVVEVRSQEGAYRIEAPYVFVSPGLTKRAMVALTDLIWMTVHPANSEDLDELERELIMEDWPRIMQEGDL